jgi:hypothetical protein
MSYGPSLVDLWRRAAASCPLAGPLGPARRPRPKRGQYAEELPPLASKTVLIVNQLYHASFGQFPEPLTEDAWRHIVASELQLPKSGRVVPQFPHDAKHPPAPEEIEQRHDRTSRPRAPDRPPRRRHRRSHVAAGT